MNQLKNWTLGLFVATLLATGPAQVQASVQLKNGNFFIGYTDIIYSGGFEPKMERIYNSKTPFKGVYGWGWGNEYEVYLTISADGSAVVHEYGGGAENRFTPTAFNAAELDKAVKEIVDTAVKAGVAGSGGGIQTYTNKLKTDATFRNDEWQKFVDQGKLKPRQLKNDAKLISNRFSFQFISRVQGGYLRISESGKVEKFGENGKLLRVSDKNGNFIDFTYGKDGHMSKLVDNFNRKMFFQYNNQGLLTKIDGENSKSATFSYNDRAELTKSVDVDGNEYTFKYDTAGRHNLVGINYSDKTSMEVAYWGQDKSEHVKSVKDRDGTLTEYVYNIKGNIFGVTVTVKGSDKKPIGKTYYEYEFATYKDGGEWTRRLKVVADGDVTDTTYNECCGLPLQIKHGSDVTTFEYDTKGHVTKKTTPSEITELHYDPTVGKVDRVAKYSKFDKKEVSWSTFEYDAKGNLKFAKNSEGKGVKLAYDNSGRIMSLVDQNHRQVNFKYNEDSKPEEITDPAVGTIRVTYTNTGEIKKVDSTAGRKIALQVTSAFQNLLDIIRPAGVSLTF
ncbi:MAG: RHS repeat protein [Bdellovibrio sp.]|nr:RHS repeat protein [Bdellovibrio sp.]